MGTLAWYRVARRAVGLAPQPEYPHLEALLEGEASKPHNDYRILARVVPAIIAVLACASIVPVILTKNPLTIAAPIGFSALAGALWLLFDRMDKAIPASTARIRMLSEQIWGRYSRFANVVGIEPALSPAVGQIVNEAAGIYMKHTGQHKPGQAKVVADQFTESRAKAVKALEEAMARILELAQPQTVHAQELELASGWAKPLLSEMRDMDRALDQHLQATIANSHDPLATLREARMELQGQENAFVELEQNRSS